MQRTALISRKTKETAIELSINLDGSGESKINTSMGFFDHMLEQISKHSLIDLKLTCQGDLHIDYHHSVEDVGICLGQAILQAIGDKAGIYRYGSAYVPLDEALARVVLDLSGRSFISYQHQFTINKIGNFDTELVEEFFTAIANNGKMALHIDQLKGVNAHHIAETQFKAFGRALRQAASFDERNKGIIPSSKGYL